MDPVSIAAAATSSAVAIAKAAGLGDWLKARFNNKPGAKTAEKIIDLAGKVVGGGPPDEILERLQHDAEAAAETKRELLRWEQELVRLQYQDLADARAMYSDQSAMADKLGLKPLDIGLHGGNIFFPGSGLAPLELLAGRFKLGSGDIPLRFIAIEIRLGDLLADI